VLNETFFQVWLAAHVERKLSKNQLLHTSIPKSVQVIMSQDMMPMALRLSGQLLLGVTRIYSRQAKYLMDDCNEALLKIKMAFRPGAVDMTEEQEAVARNAITLQESRTEYDMMYGDSYSYGYVNLCVSLFLPGQIISLSDCLVHHSNALDITLELQGRKSTKNTMASVADITLPIADYDLDLDFGADAISSQQFDVDLDLGLDLGLDVGGGSKRKRTDGEEGEDNGSYDFDRSVEVGRDAPGSADKRSARFSPGSLMVGAADGDVTMKSYGPDDFGMEWDLGPIGGEAPMDIDFDLGLGGTDPVAGGQSKQAVQHSRPSNFTDPSDSAAPGAGTLALAQGASANDKSGRDVKKPRLRKQIIDSVTELEMGRGLTSLSQSSSSQALAASRQARFERGLLVESRFLPRSRVHLGLIELDARAADYLLPHVKEGGKLLQAGPAGLPPELDALFTFRVDTNRAARGRKRPAGEDFDRSMEIGRRRDQSLGGASDILGAMDGGAGFDDFNGFQHFDGNDWLGVGDAADEEDPSRPVELDDSKQAAATAGTMVGSRKSSPRKRAAKPDYQDDEDEVPAFDELADDTPRGHAHSALAIFDVSTAVANAAASQQPHGQLEENSGSSQKRPGGYSANTLKALKVLGDRLPRFDAEEDSAISFDGLSKNASNPSHTLLSYLWLNWQTTGLASRCVDHVLRVASPGKPRLS
jgi:cohesin complex subunit SCC1